MMTRDEIMSLSPKQLREEIAKAKGILPYPSDRCPVCGWLYGDCQPDDCSFRPSTPFMRADDNYPHWPANTGDAMALVDELNDDGYKVIIVAHDRENHEVFAEWIDPSDEGENGESITAYSDTAALAICRAWLMWKKG